MFKVSLPPKLVFNPNEVTAIGEPVVEVLTAIFNMPTSVEPTATVLKEGCSEVELKYVIGAATTNDHLGYCL